jgi:N-methylhydantoinase A
VIDLATVNMARAIRVISVERGYDPRDYILVAFGGAGPLHACSLADELGIGHLIEGGRSFGAVAAATPRMLGIAFKLDRSAVACFRDHSTSGRALTTSRRVVGRNARDCLIG